MDLNEKRGEGSIPSEALMTVTPDAQVAHFLVDFLVHWIYQLA